MEKWSNERTLNFINSVHLRPELWDVESSVYKDRNLKKDSWLAVADEYGISPEDAYKKFRSLRTYAKWEEKKLLQRKSGGFGGSSSSTWFAFDAMSFILSQDLCDTGVDSENTTAETQYKNVIILDEEERATLEPDVRLTSPAPDYTVHRRAPHRERLPDATLQILDRASRRRRNTSAAFGEHVANKLMRYCDAIRSEVEFKISKLLYEADMKMLHSEQSTSNFGPHSPELLCSDSEN